MRHAKNLVSPAEALRSVFFPAVATCRNTSFIPVISFYQQRCASSTSEASPGTYRSFRPSGVVSPRKAVPRSDSDDRAHDDKNYSSGARTTRSFGYQSSDNNSHPREYNDRSFGYSPPRSFGPRPESSARPREDSNRSLDGPAFRSFGPRYDPERRPREPDKRSFGVPPPRTFGPRSDSKSRPREHSDRSFGPSTPREFGPRSREDGPPRDEAIRSMTIRIVSADNKLQELSYLPDILASIDRKTHFIQQVSPADDPKFPIPVCKIIDKKENRDQEKARAKAVKSSQQAAKAKKLELSWGIGKHDLEHRMNKVREFLEDGRRVEIVVGASRRKGQAKKAAKIEAQEAAETFKTIRDAVASIGDVTEWRPMDGTVGAMVTLYLEAKAKKGKGSNVEKGEESAD
ncbi:hypothetical protein MMC18_001017 [Xylographa bjoerkii]|nr:hypothetical protein [Xylographa bjoerkii]